MANPLFKAKILGIGTKPDHTALLLRVTHAGDCDVSEISNYRLAQPVLATVRLQPDTLENIAAAYEGEGLYIHKHSRIFFAAKGIIKWDPNCDKSSHWGHPIHRLSCFDEESLCPAYTHTRKAEQEDLLLNLQVVSSPSVAEAAATSMSYEEEADFAEEDVRAEMRAAFDEPALV